MTSPKHDWGLLKTGGSVKWSKWSAAGGWMDRETLLHALQDFLAECPSPQWSIEQSVYCKVGLIPGEEEKWFLVTGGKLTLSSLWQLWGARQILTDPFPRLGSVVGVGGVSMSGIVMTLAASLGAESGRVLASAPSFWRSLPRPSTGRLSGKHTPVKWAAGASSFLPGVTKGHSTLDF